MAVVDIIEIWWLTVCTFFEASGVTGVFERSPTDRPNPSCNLNLRRGEYEADLLVWESGEAEFAIAEPNGAVHQQHFEDVRNPAVLEAILMRLSTLARVG